MRVKILGEITSERLAEALEAARVRCTDREGIEKISFFGANLYSTTYDRDGNLVTLQDSNGKDVTITHLAIPGFPNRPALSEDGKSQRASQQEEYKRFAEAERIRTDEQQKKAEIAMLALKKQIDQDAAAVKSYDDATRSMIEANSADTIKLFNSVIDAVWQDMKPVYPSGKSKGALLTKPKFDLGQANQLMLHRDDTGVHYVLVRNPICKISNHSIVAFWKNDAWTKVSQLLFAELNKHARSEAGLDPLALTQMGTGKE